MCWWYTSATWRVTCPVHSQESFVLSWSKMVFSQAQCVFILEQYFSKWSYAQVKRSFQAWYPDAPVSIRWHFEAWLTVFVRLEVCTTGNEVDDHLYWLMKRLKMWRSGYKDLQEKVSGNLHHRHKYLTLGYRELQRNYTCGYITFVWFKNCDNQTW